MKDWAAQLPEWFLQAEHEAAGLLHEAGQDNEVVAFGLVVLGLLLVLTLVWAIALGLLRGVLSVLGLRGGRSAPATGPDMRDFGYVATSAREEPGRLDVIPSTAAVKSAPPRARDEAASEPRLAAAAGRAPANPAHGVLPPGELHRVKVRDLPKPAARGPVISARPEWTGKVVPSSLEDAGAVEVCRVLSRRASPTGSASVRAVDYRICGLPRVDASGHRQPDLLVYSVLDRGFLPKAAEPKSTKRR